jgi:hypothetical protein|tara:strand:- start:211 stop:477 length:267 start_codon:yes stop_codon:yes gene_type:complete
MSDAVNEPSHYVVGGVEMFDTFRTVYGDDAALGFALGNVFKYSWRAANKNAKHADKLKQIEDLNKGIRYASFAITILEDQNGERKERS